MNEESYDVIKGLWVNRELQVIAKELVGVNEQLKMLNVQVAFLRKKILRKKKNKSSPEYAVINDEVKQ